MRTPRTNENGNAPEFAVGEFSVIRLGLTKRLALAGMIAAVVWLMVLTVIQG